MRRSQISSTEQNQEQQVLCQIAPACFDNEHIHQPGSSVNRDKNEKDLILAPKQRRTLNKTTVTINISGTFILGCLLIFMTMLTFHSLGAELENMMQKGILVDEHHDKNKAKGHDQDRFFVAGEKNIESTRNDKESYNSGNTTGTDFHKEELYKISESGQQHAGHQCAKWVPESKRNVLFVHGLGMKNFTQNKDQKFMSGEFYAAASWDYAIRQNGFRVDEVSWEHFESMPVDALENKYHRIVLTCTVNDWSEKCTLFNEKEKLEKLGMKLRQSNVRHKIGALYWWDHDENETPGFFGEDFFHPKQVLAPFDWQSTNTFLGMFPHCFRLDREEGDLPSAKRGRVGLVLGKRGEFFDDDAIRVIQALVQKNFTIHTTCLHGDCHRVRLIEGTIIHRKLDPEGYANLMRQASFLLGIGNPIISPSPIIAMANGVAFLNPRRWGAYQHPLLAKEGEPHVYNIEDFGDIDDIIEKAEASVRDRNRFSSHIPSDYRVENVVDRVCSMMHPNDLRGEQEE